MTTYKLCSVRDQAAQTYNRPFAAPTTGFAIRSFSDEVNNAQSPMQQHPNDYELFELGEFDDSNGQISTLQSPRPLARAIDYLLRSTNETKPQETRQ